MTQVEELVKEKVRQMPMYKVLVHNDPITTFQFVILVLITIFNKESEEALRLTKEIHLKDIGLAGVYPLEHAEHLVDLAKSLARTQKFPLAFTIEPA